MSSIAPFTPSPGAAAVSADLLAPDERERLRRLVWQGFLLRLVLALVLEVTGFSSKLAPDERTYQRNGRAISNYWSSTSSYVPEIMLQKLPRGYFYMNAVNWTLFRDQDFPLKALNALVGALACGLVYRLARGLYGRDVAWRAALLYQFFPSLVLWSALNIRDVWVVFLLLFISLKSLEVVRRYSTASFLGVLAGVWAVSLFRDYLVVVVAIPPIVAVLLGRGGNAGRNVILALVASLAVLVVIQQQMGSGRVEHYMSLETMSSIREDMASGQSSFQEDVDISTPGAALAFLPVGIAYFLFSPFPWEITSFLKLIALPEMLFLYYLTPAIFRGIRLAIRTQLRDSLQVLLLTGLLTVSYALGEGNVGTLYRHRAQAMSFFLIFAALGYRPRAEQKALAAAA